MKADNTQDDSLGSNQRVSLSNFDLGVLVDVIRGNLSVLLLGPLAVGLIALAVSYKIPPTYTATTKFLPPQQQTSSAAAMIQSLGAVSGLAGAATGLKNPGDQYVSFLKSRAVLDALVKRFDLLKKYEVEFAEDAAKALEDSTLLISGKDGLIVVAVDDPNPKLASMIANAYVEELGKLMDRLAITEAQQRRFFFEKQLSFTKEKLAAAEVALRKSGINSDVLKVAPASAVDGIAKIQAEVKAQEVKISSMRQYYTESAMELKIAQAELNALKAQSKRMNDVDSLAGGDSGYVSKYREYKYQENLYEIFSRQYEIAKTDEAREGAVIQVLDLAQVPERKSKPARGRIAILSSVISGVFFLSCLMFFGENRCYSLFGLYKKKIR